MRMQLNCFTVLIKLYRGKSFQNANEMISFSFGDKSE